MDMLFESEKQKEATERLLASVRVRTINSEIDAYLNEMLGYAKEIDSILEKNNLGARYLDRVSMIDKVDSVYLDEDLTNIDFTETGFTLTNSLFQTQSCTIEENVEGNKNIITITNTTTGTVLTITQPISSSSVNSE